MPFKSKSQQRAMHAKANAGKIPQSTVHEFDEATKAQPGGFGALPEHVGAAVGAHVAHHVAQHAPAHLAKAAHAGLKSAMASFKGLPGKSTPPKKGGY